MHELFIYWRAAPGQWQAAVEAVHSLQTALRAQHPQLSARVLRRTDGSHTLMETYAHPLGLGPELHATLVQGLALARWCDGRRHVESFEALG